MNNISDLIIIEIFSIMNFYIKVTLEMPMKTDEIKATPR